VKIAVIGGGSSYTPELINGTLERAGSLPIDEIWLMDISPQRLEVVGGFAQRMVRAAGAPFAVHLTTDRREAITDASYVITQLRVGGMEARREDEYLGRRHGLVGQETTGIGGMAKAMRTIPVVLDVARDMRDLAPGALLINFANPSGLVTEALTRYAEDVPSVGLCNGPITAKRAMLEALGEHRGIDVAPEEATLDVLGLNHLSWFRGLTVGESDLWPTVLQIFLEEMAAPRWDRRTIEVLGMVPNGYLQYYYYTADKVADQQDWPPSRAEEVMEIEARLLRQYAESDRTEPPEDLMKRGGAYYSTVATQLIDAHHNDRGQIHVASARHAGAVPGWPEDWVLEMNCRVDRAGVHPLPADPLPPVCFGLMAHVKMYEILTAEAAVRGDRKTAYSALLAHPLGPSADRVDTVLDDMLTTHREYLPQFWNGQGISDP
jgi:6-phospho-beta-glucosidase